ncbi:MAG: hypothetical protein WC155_03810 [Candidatus Cloacimonadales bacterium]
MSCQEKVVSFIHKTSNKSRDLDYRLIPWGKIVSNLLKYILETVRIGDIFRNIVVMKSDFG